MVPFRDPFEWQENYGRYLLNIHTGAYCRFDQQPTNGQHVHNYYEICLITGGTGDYGHDGKTYSLTAGDVILARPGAAHEIASLKTRDLQLVFFSFEIHGGPENAARGEKETLVAGIMESTQIHSRGHRRLLGYLQILSRDLPANWMLKRTLGTFLTDLLAALTPTRIEEDVLSEKTYVESAIDYIDINIRKPIQVQEIARAIGLSERSLRRYFSRILNKTIVEVVRERKLNRSTALLRMSFDVGSVGQMLSLEPSHFSRAFRKQFGVSPRDYQKAYQRKIVTSPDTVHRLPGNRENP